MVAQEQLVNMQYNDDGQFKMIVNLKQEHYELLKLLFESDAWKLYRKLLIQAKEGYFHLALSLDDPNKVLKNMGTAAGVNFAVNQLDLLMFQYKKQQAKLVDGEPTNHPQSEG
jgi:hypothetical protein